MSEGANEQAGSGNQDDAERDFSEDESLTLPLAAAAGRAATSFGER